MNYDMFSNNKNDELDPNYIYPRPYIDPMMYVNSYSPNPNQGQNPQSNTVAMEEYMTYMNPYMNNPMMANFDDDMDYDDYYPYVDMNSEGNITQDMGIEAMNQGQFQNPNMNTMPNMNMTPNMQFMPNMNMTPNMQFMPNMNMTPNMQCMPNMNMMPNMQCIPGMMFPGMMPGMMFPGMMSPYMMMPGIPQIHLEEFDEEEM